VTEDQERTEEEHILFEAQAAVRLAFVRRNGVVPQGADGSACDEYAKVVVRTAAYRIECQVLRTAAIEMEQSAKYWRNEYMEAPDGSDYETVAGAKADTYTTAAESLRAQAAALAAVADGAAYLNADRAAG
jgi:hypothetical protein